MTLKLHFFKFSIIFFLFTCAAFATDYTVNSVSQFNALNLQPCDVVTWTNGTYSNQDIVFTGMGESGSPIVLRAETPGGVIFTGESKFNMYGDYLIVDGFYWNGGIGLNNHFELRRSGSSSDFATNSIVRNCAFNDLQPEDPIGEPDAKSRWIVMYGTNNTVENCSFLNKDTTGVCILVELSQAVSGNVNHTIKNNYFYNVSAKDGRLNSGDSEGMRIGSSGQQAINANVLVEGNYFQEVDGENEIISNKSAGNTFRNNTFRNCRGSLVLRHGANALIEGNYFLGENKARSGGIRISDQDHVIINNYMQDLDNTSDSFNNGITLMGGNATSGGTSNGYQNVNNILIAFNTIYDSNDPIHFNDSRGNNVPQGTIANNLIFNTSGNTNIITGDISQIGGNITYDGNIFGGTTVGVTDSGITVDDGEFSASGEIFKPSTIGPAPNASSGTYTQVTIDIQGFNRPTTNKDVGAHEILGATGMATNNPIIDANVGDTIGVCYLNATGMASSSACTIINYGNSCAPIPVTSVSVSPDSGSIEVGSSIQLTATVSPNNATNTSLSWSTENSSIATVDGNGLVTAQAEGIVTITTITDDGGFTDTTNITVTAPLMAPDCAVNTNLATSGSIESFTDEQATNPATNLIDDNTSSRWSSMYDVNPQSAVIDLGAAYYVNGVTLFPHQERDYQYLIEGSETSATTGFETLVDRTSNTQGGISISDTFSFKTVRYVRLTVSDAATYTGVWCSIEELQVNCAGVALSIDDNLLQVNTKVYPNPFKGELHIEIPINQIETISKIRLIETSGKLIFETKTISENMTLAIGDTLENGLYFLQFIGKNQETIATKKILK